jgi:hypothetical protein
VNSKLSDEVPKSGKRLLDPMERIAEVLFGLIMVLTITCSFSLGGEGRIEVRDMLFGALGCNVAWGVIDAVMYLMACFSERGQSILALRAVRVVANPDKAHRMIADAMPPLLASVVSNAQFEEMRQKLTRIPEPPLRPRLNKKDWLASAGVFLLVLSSTFPVGVPFIFIQEPTRALRISNLVAIVMLFLTGYAFGRASGYRPWLMGTSMVIVGSSMVGLTIALGG